MKWMMGLILLRFPKGQDIILPHRLEFNCCQFLFGNEKEKIQFKEGYSTIIVNHFGIKNDRERDLSDVYQNDMNFCKNCCIMAVYHRETIYVQYYSCGFYLRLNASIFASEALCHSYHTSYFSSRAKLLRLAILLCRKECNEQQKKSYYSST